MRRSSGNGWAGATGLSLVYWIVFIIHIRLIGLTPSIFGKVGLLFAADPVQCLWFSLGTVVSSHSPETCPIENVSIDNMQIVLLFVLCVTAVKLHFLSFLTPPGCHQGTSRANGI